MNSLDAADIALDRLRANLAGMEEPQKAQKLHEIRSFVENCRQVDQQIRRRDLPREIADLERRAHTLEAELPGQLDRLQAQARARKEELSEETNRFEAEVSDEMKRLDAELSDLTGQLEAGLSTCRSQLAAKKAELKALEAA